MKKGFSVYVIIWILLLGLFNLFTFIIPAWPTLEKFTPSFWIGWGVTIGAFLGQLICAGVAFKENSPKKTFYNISLFTTSYSGLVATFIVAMIFIILTPLPYWSAAIACSVVLTVNIIAVVKAIMTVSLVDEIDEKIATATEFIYNMRESGEALLAKAKSDEIKVICKKVNEAFKFSDPMSNRDLTIIESDILMHFNLLKKSAEEDNTAVAESECNALLALISERNNKCKRMK